eukprot:9563187-Prorocentrum_lima.AAC.1
MCIRDRPNPVPSRRRNVWICQPCPQDSAQPHPPAAPEREPRHAPALVCFRMFEDTHVAVGPPKSPVAAC